MSDAMTIPAPRAAEGAPCWSCGAVTHADGCAACGAIQPPRPADAFARLGLEARFDLAPAAIDRAYFERQRRYHPDRFAGQSATTATSARYAAAHAAAVNEAYETLRDPLRRAELLLRRAGVDLVRAGSPAQDRGILQAILGRREELAAAATGAERDGVLDATRSDLGAAERALAEAFGAGRLEVAARAFVRARYLAKILADASGRSRRPGGA